MVSIEKENLN